MTNEIKEIIEALKSHNDIVKDYPLTFKEYPLTLSIEEQKILLDYITNLQERIDKAVEYIDNCFVGEEVPRGDDYVFNEYYYYEPLEKEEARELLNILRGDE